MDGSIKLTKSINTITTNTSLFNNNWDKDVNQELSSETQYLAWYPKKLHNYYKSNTSVQPHLKGKNRVGIWLIVMSYMYMWGI